MSKIKNIPNIEENKLFNNLDFKKLKFSPSPKDFVTYKEGSVIYKTGEETDYIYLLAQGSVKIKINVPGETAKIVKIESNDFFGEKELIDNTKRMSSAVANSDSIIVSIKKSDISTFLDRQVDFKKNLYQHTYEEAKPNSNSAQAIIKKELEPIQSPFPIDFNEIDNKENSEPVVNIEELRLDDLLNDTENKFINVDNLDDETTFRVFNDAIADAAEIEPEKKEEEKNSYTFPFNTLNVTDEEQLVDEEVPADYSLDSDSDLYENDEIDFSNNDTNIEDLKNINDNNIVSPYSADTKENEAENEFSFLSDNIEDEIEPEKGEDVNATSDNTISSLTEETDTDFLEDYHENIESDLDYSADFLFENDEKKTPLSFDLNDLDDNNEFSFLKNKELDKFNFQDDEIDDHELYQNEVDLEISSLDDFKFTSEEKEEKQEEELFEDFTFNNISNEKSFLENEEEIIKDSEEDTLNIPGEFNDLSDSVKFPKDTASEIKIDLEFDNIDDTNSWKLSPEQEEALITDPLFKPEEDSEIKLDDFQLDDILDDDVKFSPFGHSSIQENISNNLDNSETKEIEPPLFEDFFVDGLNINDDVNVTSNLNNNQKEEFKVTFYDNDSTENSWNNFDFNLQDDSPEFSLPTDLNSIPLSESLLSSDNNKTQKNDEDISKKLQAFANVLLEDLKSPLKVIKTSTDILSQKETNEQLKQVLEIINTQADSVFNNLQNYLDFNNGDVVLNTSTYDFNDVIDEVIVKLAQYTASANKNVFKKLSSVKFNVNVDKEKIYLVFYQIIKYFILVEPAISSYYILAIKRGSQAIIEFRVKEGKFENKELGELFNTNNIKNLAEKGNLGLALALNIIKKHNGSFETEALSSGASIKIILNI